MSITEILQPRSIDQVKSYLSELNHAKILAGGTDLMLDINSGKINCNYLVSLNKVNELKRIKDYGHHLVIGSMVTFADLKNLPYIQSKLGAVRDCADFMGSPQIRNVATIGGNIANAVPAADILPCLMCFDTALSITGSGGTRVVKLTEYFKSYSLLKLKDNELITDIIINKENGVSGFYKLGRRNSLAISRLSASVFLRIENGLVENARIILGTVGRYPLKVHEVERIIKGKEVEFLFDKEVMNLLEDKVYESIKTRKSITFKREAVKGVYKEAIYRALGRLGK